MFLASCSSQDLDPLFRMARLHNLVPSILLVMVGAWVSGTEQCDDRLALTRCILLPMPRQGIHVPS